MQQCKLDQQLSCQIFNFLISGSDKRIKINNDT